MKLNKLHLINEALKEFDNIPSTKRLSTFIKEKHNIVKRYREAWFEKLFFGNTSIEDKYSALFIDSINAGGIGRLDDKSKSLLDFEKNFALKYKNDKRQMFVDLFEDKIYKQLKLKKSGLLILSAYYTHLIDDKDLSENSDKIVLPIDVVICSIFSYVLPKKYEKIIMSNSDELKKALTKYAKEKFGENYPDFVKLDDLWFWGHFATKRNKKTGLIDSLLPNETQINLD